MEIKPKAKRKVTVAMIIKAHQIFFDETGLYIGLSIDKAIKKILNI